MTVTYLRDTASEAGIGTLGISMNEIGADDARGEFVDLAGSRIASLFKLYSWEWMVHDQDLALAQMDGRCPVIGAWVIDGVPAGMGIRESDAPVTGNLARFVPHRLI
jgi:glutathionylspermidine synthase